jgi:DNA-binding GntR family transcriptional regulator
VPANSAELALTHAEPEEVFNAIVRKDAAAAQLAMAHHISKAWDRRSRQLKAAGDLVFT